MFLLENRIRDLYILKYMDTLTQTRYVGAFWGTRIWVDFHAFSITVHKVDWIRLKIILVPFLNNLDIRRTNIAILPSIFIY